MGGFALPKFRWLIIGAAVAGGWAMTQEPPARRPSQETVEQRVASAPRRDISLAKQSRDDEPVKKRAEPRALAAALPQAKPAVTQERPSEEITASIPRPPNPVGEVAKGKTLYTSESVKLRKAASTSSEILQKLKPGQSVSVIEVDGKWRRVKIAGQTGWVHGDYLSSKLVRADSSGKATVETVKADRPKSGKSDKLATTKPTKRPAEIAGASNIPRPKQVVAKSDAKRTGVVEALFGADRPIRPPQGGDCQCPYDIMLNGKQCGQHSAYTRQNGKGLQCYF